ncbi:MAG: hypothetical protein ACKO6N_15120 [Myxococcota bacterium]
MNGAALWAGFQRLLVRAGVYLLGLLLLVWPLPLSFSTRLLGHPEVDVWNHIWGFWWVGQTLLERGVLPVETHLLVHPTGGRLYFIDPLNAVLSAPLQPLLGLATSYNLVLCFELWLAGMSGHAVARAAGASERAGYLAGFLLLFSPFLRCETHNGITEVLNLGWLGLALAAILHALQRGGLGWSLLAGGLSGLAFVACWYYGLAIGMAGVGLLLWGLLFERPRGWGWAKAGLHVGAAGLAAGLVAAPLLRAFLWTLQGQDAIIQRMPDTTGFLLRHNATDLLSFFMPGDYFKPDHWREYGERFLHTTYLGWIGLGLAGGSFGHSRARMTLRLGVMGLAFAVLALGPYLFVHGDFLVIEGHRFALPFATLFHGLGLMSITHPARLVASTLLCLGALAALGWDRLELRLGRWGRVLWVGVLGALMLELLLLGPGPWPLPTASARYAESSFRLREAREAGAVLDLPARHYNTMLPCRYLYEQTLHGRPVPYRVDVKAERAPGLLQDPLGHWLVALAHENPELPARHPSPARERLRRLTQAQKEERIERMLRAQGYRAVVVHRELPSPPFGAWPYRALLEPVLGAPEVTADGQWIFWLKN